MPPPLKLFCYFLYCYVFVIIILDFGFFDIFVGPIQGLGPISIDRSRLADNFGGGISFWDVLYVDFEDIYYFKMKIPIF